MNIDKKVLTGSVIAVIGVCGIYYFSLSSAIEFDFILRSVRLAVGTTASMIVCFSGLAGILYKSLTPRHLKIIDLVWVLASAVAVVFAFVQVTQLSADAYRTSVSQNVEKSKILAKEFTARAFKEQCGQSPTLTVQQCENLRRIGISIDGGGYLSPALVESLCPRPIDLSNPPLGFGSSLVASCIHSGVIARSADDPVMKDKSNVDEWGQKTRLWPLLMIVLVALRVAKSVAEVFFGIK